MAFAVTSNQFAFGQSLSIRTLAGGTDAGATNGFGSNARFNLPLAVGADGTGNVYVVDTLNSTVRKITPDGYASTLAGQAGNSGSADGTGSSAHFSNPQGIASDVTGQLYIADSANHTVRKVNPAGAVSTWAGAPGNFNSFDGAGTNAQFFHPEGTAVDGAGNVYVADTWNHTIRKITPSGLVSTLAGLAGNAGSADGTNSKARFNRPVAIALDNATNLFVADSFNHAIRRITPAGTVNTIAGMPGVWGSADGTNTDARFYLPAGIGIDANGNLFVADSGNQTLRRISPSGTNWVVSTAAGQAGQAGTVNGTGTNAQFFFPAGLTFDHAGYLYVADTANNTVRTTRVVPPTLQYRVFAGQLVLSWPTSAEGFALESSSALSAPGWSPVASGMVPVADNFVFTNSASVQAFYRLHFP